MLDNEKLVAILSRGNQGHNVDFLVLPKGVCVEDAHEVVEKLCPQVPLEQYLREACHGRYAKSPEEIEIYATGINPNHPPSKPRERS
jgi:hypothetical protein